MTAFRSHPDNPESSHHLKTLNLITRAKILSPYRVTFTGSRDSDLDTFRDHYSAEHRF